MSVYVSALDLFSIGIGPSSSHTVGPMRAAGRFVAELAEAGILPHVTRVECTLYGSLAATGVGHGTPDAVVAGLAGERSETCDPAAVHGAWARATEAGMLTLGTGSAPDASSTGYDTKFGSNGSAATATADTASDARAGDEVSTLRQALGRSNSAGRVEVPFQASDLTFEPRTRMPEHPNALTLRAYAAGSRGPIVERTFFSIGGGFIAERGVEAEPDESGSTGSESAESGSVGPRSAGPGSAGIGSSGPRSAGPGAAGPGYSTQWPFSTAAELLALCAEHRLGVCDVAYRIELERHGEAELLAGLDAIRNAMHDCVERGLHAHGELPGGLHVPRRAEAMREQLDVMPADAPDFAAEWMRAYALAVNEENAAGGRVVTAPTNGAAGIVPAVLEYHLRFNPRATDADAHRYLLTAAAIGSILKANASISGAEGGCQAEVGSACAMAAAGLCAVLGGTPDQVENAAEIAVEHHLGLTCDPVGGLVQIPCIERNAIAASTAVSAARLALHGDGRHLVPLDVAVETMRQTGADMSDRYKETSAAGLAVNVIEC
ncbi:L-serine ammonia-lyase [Humibacter antri]